MFLCEHRFDVITEECIDCGVAYVSIPKVPSIASAINTQEQLKQDNALLRAERDSTASGTVNISRLAIAEVHIVNLEKERDAYRAALEMIEKDDAPDLLWNECNQRVWEIAETVLAQYATTQVERQNIDSNSISERKSKVVR
jgi:hypothetical protein